jgi:PAS domain S-box-containing protein
MFSLATLLTFPLWEPLFRHVPFTAYFAAVAVSASYCGMSYGMATAVLAGAAVMLYQGDGRLAGATAAAVLVATLISFLATARRAAVTSLRSSEARQTASIEVAMDCVVSMDHTGRVVEWNPSAARTFGYSREEAIGQEMASLVIPPALRDTHRAGLARYLQTGAAVVLGKRLELTAVRRDGSEFPVELAITRLPASDPPMFTAYLRDISDRRAAEKQREELFAQRERLLTVERAARTEAERAGRMKDEFLATLSHELRTPLTSILGWSHILQGGGLDGEELREGLRTIERNAQAQTRIIEDLLDMSRIISGKVRLDVQPVDLAAVVQGVIDTVRPAAEAKTIRVQAVLEPLPGPISGDPNRLQQVFWNLLTNAIKFTPKNGRVQVTLQRVNSHVEVVVSDTGEGIAADFLPFVFDRFRQADATTSRRHGGLGLGLSIVKQLVELHGGTISVTSGGAGEGSTFTVILPAAVVQTGRVAATDPASGATGESGSELAGRHIVVIDDESDARSFLRRLLESRGAAVATAGSVAHGLEALRASRADVVICDIGMPGEDGYDFIARLRSLPAEQGGNTPAIALTAYAGAQDRIRCVKAGFQVHLSKPVDPGELIANVATLATRG